MASEIIGREHELAEVRRFLDPANGVPAALTLEGEPGIGKTVLWREGVELARARGFRVLRAIPATAETRLSFAALADLLEPVLADVLPTLPPPQRRALEVALLLEDARGAPPDRRAVAFAFLGAVKSLAREGPVVIAVDDVQWLDGPSAFMVEFALRRLRDEPVAFLITLRTGDEPPPPDSSALSRRRHSAADRRTAQPRRPSSPPGRPTRPGALAPDPASPASALGREPVLRARARASHGARLDPARGRRGAADVARDARPATARGAAGRNPGRAARGLRPVAADDRPRGGGHGRGSRARLAPALAAA